MVVTEVNNLIFVNIVVAILTLLAGFGVSKYIKSFIYNVLEKYDKTVSKLHVSCQPASRARSTLRSFETVPELFVLCE